MRDETQIVESFVCVFLNVADILIKEEEDFKEIIKQNIKMFRIPKNFCEWHTICPGFPGKS